MKGRTLFGIVFLIAGVVLAFYGFNEKNSFGNQFGSLLGQNNTTMYYIIGGIVLAVFGIYMLVRKGSK